MNPENKKLVMFDFDGVLVNTLDVCFEADKEVNHGLSKEEYKNFFDGNVHDALRIDGTKRQSNPNFSEMYIKNTRAFSIPEVLIKIIKNLSSKYFLCIVSSTSTRAISSLLGKEQLQEVFSDVYGGDISGSKVVKIKMLLEKYNLQPHDSVFITDTLGDIKEAHECEVRSIAVTWGFHDRQRLEKGNPEKIIENPVNLLDAVIKIFQ